jgi:hypothetical protein
VTGISEEQFNNENQDAYKEENEKLNNNRILTPRIKKLMENKDARGLLQQEINESVLRVK